MRASTPTDAVANKEPNVNADTLIQKFEQDGYVVVEEVLNAECCAELLKLIIGSCGSTGQDYIIASDYRLHTPLALNPLTVSAMQQVVKPAYRLLSGFLCGEQRLVELSSITVFPNALAQNLHPDEQNIGKHLVSVFVNLVPTCRESGALLIVPGSHHAPEKDYSLDAAIPVEIPAGSAVFMNSKTTHAGGGNSTIDRIRPVFYFSIGDSDLDGPTYSIRDDVKAQGLVLSDLYPDSAEDIDCPLDCIPYLSPGVDLLTSEFNNHAVFLMRNNQFMGELTITPEIAWILKVMRLIADKENCYSVAELSQQLNASPEAILRVCRQLRYDQIISWT